MLTPQQIDALRIVAGQLLDPVIEFLIEDIARRVSEATQLTSTASYQIWRAQSLGLSQAEIRRRIAALLMISQQDVAELFRQAAQVGYDFDVARFPTAEAVDFKDNPLLQEIVRNATVTAQNGLSNIVQTIGMVSPTTGKPLPLQQAYYTACDSAYLQVSTGAADPITAVQRACATLESRGLVSIDYASGRHMSAEAAVRLSVMSTLGDAQQRQNNLAHDMFGCDGWEISAHMASAPDHEPIQGKQYTDAEFQALNGSLRRAIGTLNCGHVAMPIKYGITPPQYSDAELERYRADNELGIAIGGKHYSTYQATQAQRAMERDMRQTKRELMVANGAGDPAAIQAAKTRLQLQLQAYNEFSNKAGLVPQFERTEIPGFRL